MDPINHSLPRLVCPAVRTENLKSQRLNEIVWADCPKVDSSYYIFNAKDGESSHSHHLLPLIGCNNRETVTNLPLSEDREEETECGACRNSASGTTYYFCTECDKWYHKECVESPPVFKSPYHPKHSLQLHVYKEKEIYMLLECLSHFTRCGSLFYHCSICNFSLDPICATKPTFINHPKRHEHTLYYFTRKAKVTCDVCGENSKYFIFVCLHCDFVVHKKCIYLPQVIKLSLHKHRLSFASSLSSGEWACGVCHKPIDKKYGAYTCMTKGCIYGVHTNCATSRTRGIIWDRKELEGEPEEDDENIKPPFEEIRDGIILHFSHPEHPMRLDEDVKRWCGEEKYCQACILPLYDGKTYTCVECDYVLHEECAYLPRVKHHALHAHLLTLEPCFTQIKQCQYCEVESCGFKYVCYNVDCNNFSLDVRCASISEPYDHHLHIHPLLFNSTSTCMICSNRRETLACDDCGFLLCFRCAGLPYKVRYLNDEHLLTFSYKEFTYLDYMASSDISEGSYEEDVAKGDYSCDLCEEAIILRGDSRTGFYRCKKCEVALHIECYFGKDLYMNPGSRVTVQGEEFNIVKNSALTRPICMGCQGRCKYKMMFIAASSGDIYCSIKHIDNESKKKKKL